MYRPSREKEEARLTAMTEIAVARREVCGNAYIHARNRSRDRARKGKRMLVRGRYTNGQVDQCMPSGVGGGVSSGSPALGGAGKDRIRLGRVR